MADKSTETRKLPGNLNSSDIYLTLRNQSRDPPIEVAGNCNAIRINVTDVLCKHGDKCNSRKSADSPVKISGNCNQYRFYLTSYGASPDELVRVTGNLNKVRTESKKSKQCECSGPAESADDAQARAMHNAAQSSHENAMPQGQPPPAYEPRSEPPQGEPQDTKVLLASSISSLDALSERDSLEDLRL